MTTDRFSKFRSKAFSRRVAPEGRRLRHGPALAGIGERLRRRAADFPKRFGVMFLGCGINEHHWSAEGNGADMKLSKTLIAAGPAEAEDQCDRRPVCEGPDQPGHSSGADRQPACRASTSPRAPSSIPASVSTR